MATKSIVIDLEKCIDKEVRVTFQGGREVRGVLKGFDQLVNIVLDDCVEEMHDPDDPYKKTDERRRLGLVVCRGLQVSLVSPVDGHGWRTSLHGELNLAHAAALGAGGRGSWRHTHRTARPGWR